MKKHISSGAIIYISRNGKRKYLIMHRKKSNSWHLPKGTQETGESLKKTALREIKEETGLKIKIEKYIGLLNSVYKRDKKIVQKETYYFLAQPKDARSTLHLHDYEHDKVIFVSYKTALHHLRNYSIYEKEEEVLKIAEKMLQ